MEQKLTLAPFEEVISDWRAGKMVIIVDDADRENEGDIAVATERVTPEILSFMMTHARGLICTSISPELAQRLNLPFQTLNNNSTFHTPFAVSIDHREVGSSGVTARSRSLTMRRMVSDEAQAEDFVSPGSVMPLIAHPAGVLGRQGQTEGSYDLSRIAGLKPSGVICEILNPDGSMARGTDLVEFAKKRDIKITSIEEIIKHRIHEEVLVREVSEAKRETDFGEFDVHVFEDDVDGKEHLALVYGKGEPKSPALVRIHSECLTGDVFGSRRCDCSGQLEFALEKVRAEGAGVVIYLRQEGRGIGLANKLRAYELQDQGLDTVEANVKLGFAPDQRDFAVAAKILMALGIREVRLLTNNPQKLAHVQRFGIKVVERIPVVIEPTKYSQEYLNTKREKLGHLL